MEFAKDLYPGDKRALQAAKLHLQLDKMCRENPVFRKWLESWARRRVKKRSLSKKVKAKKPLPDGTKQLFKILTGWLMLWG
jgi:hypothetical protein